MKITDRNSALQASSHMIMLPARREAARHRLKYPDQFARCHRPAGACRSPHKAAISIAKRAFPFGIIGRPRKVYTVKKTAERTVQVSSNNENAHEQKNTHNTSPLKLKKPRQGRQVDVFRLSSAFLTLHHSGSKRLNTVWTVCLHVICLRHFKTPHHFGKIACVFI